MGQVNGYIEVEINEKNAICYTFPPAEGGVPLSVSEAMRYLDEHGLYGIDEIQLNKYLSSEEEHTFMLQSIDGLEFSESLTITFSLDKMEAICRFMPPSKGGKLMNTHDILVTLAQNNVTYGIDEEAIIQHLGEPVYATDIVLAHGTHPVHGHDASIDYFFNTNPSLKPKHNEDGTVNYRELNTICRVKKGELLARLTPADKGADGKNVCGETISAKPVRTLQLEYGKNIILSEDHLEIRSAVTGHVMLVEGKVFVSDVYDVPADVDHSTGNIKYDGSVFVHGNVRGGFREGLVLKK